jgi:hypothetical protein
VRRTLALLLVAPLLASVVGAQVPGAVDPSLSVAVEDPGKALGPGKNESLNVLLNYNLRPGSIPAPGPDPTSEENATQPTRVTLTAKALPSWIESIRFGAALVAQTGAQRSGEIERDATRRQALEGEGVIGPVGIEHCKGRGRARRNMVVIDDHDSDPASLGKVDGVVIAGPAVSRDDHGAAVVGKARSAGRRQTVSGRPTGHASDDIAPKRTQTQREHGGRGHAVDVVVSKDADAFVGPQCTAQAIQCARKVRDTLGRTQMPEAGVQETRDAFGVGEATSKQDARGQRPNAS